jgi:hypothetical protein
MYGGSEGPKKNSFQITKDEKLFLIKKRHFTRKLEFLQSYVFIVKLFFEVIYKILDLGSSETPYESVTLTTAKCQWDD